MGLLAVSVPWQNRQWIARTPHVCARPVVSATVALLPQRAKQVTYLG